jgi:excisionase family DNA binding protein
VRISVERLFDVQRFVEENARWPERTSEERPTDDRTSRPDQPSDEELNDGTSRPEPLTRLPATWGAEEAARYLRINVDTLYQRAAAGMIPGHKEGRSWIFMPHLLKQHLEAKSRAPFERHGVENVKPTLAERIRASTGNMPTRPIRAASGRFSRDAAERFE